ncbi:MAG: PIN domain-containing protein [Chloroflexi bacterium]|nr:PIN domain-containing protein [Chloroflexota bacterium]
MRFLVDANVLSEPTRPEPSPSVVRWLRAHEADLAVDPFIIGELHYGILCLPPGRRRQRLEAWFDAGVARITCIDWDDTSGLRWARLLADLRAAGRPMSVKDSLIATTALVAGLTVVTRNVRDFEAAGVPLLDPFDG